MNTENYVARVTERGGWVAFDADCPVCTALRNRWHPRLAPRGFPFVPLQDPAVARELALPPGMLPGEIQLLLNDGRRLGGLDALLFLARELPGLRPFAWVVGLPGLRSIARVAYAWVARNRHCLGDTCRAPLRREHRGHTVFFESP